MVWFLRGICKQCISRLYVYTVFKLSNPLAIRTKDRYSYHKYTYLLLCLFSIWLLILSITSSSSS